MKFGGLPGQSFFDVPQDVGAKFRRNKMLKWKGRSWDGSSIYPCFPTTLKIAAFSKTLIISTEYLIVNKKCIPMSRF